MNWLKTNWKRLAKYGGLGAGCLVVALLAFVGARYVSSGAEFDGKLIDLAPSDVSVVVRVDNLPNRKFEIERLLDHVLMQPSLGQLEDSGLWEDSIGKQIDGSLDEFRRDTWEQGISRAQHETDRLGAELFEDVFGGELILCSDPGDAGEFVALSRVGRGVRFRWQFLDIASAFFPDDPRQPTIEYSGGILRVTPPAEPGKPSRTTLITLLDDVLVIANSPRLLNAAVQLHSGGGGGMAGRDDYARTLQLVDQADADKHVAGVWLDLERLRVRLPERKTRDGTKVSPVDSFNSLPKDVEAIFPDIFVPINRILEADLDTRPFRAAYYGLDVSEPSSLMFDQYLLVNEDVISAQKYGYLRKTWAQPPADQQQLKLLPPDTILQASYRQPLEVLYNEVFDDEARNSLVGDFIVALRGEGVKAHAGGDVQEIAFALAPRHYAPEASIPLGGADLPLPAFAMMFRLPGATPAVARGLLDEYLAAQRGRVRKPGEEAAPGVVQVVEKPIEGASAYGFHDPREEDNFIRRLNRSVRAALVGEWLIMTNSEQMLAHAIRVGNGLADQPGSVWRLVPTKGSASLYLNFDKFVEYAGGPELSKVLRDNRFNTGLIDGRDPGEVRREIAAQVGTEDLGHPEVERIYLQRKADWLRVCETEGARYQQQLRADMNGLRFFRDLALITQFAQDHLHVRGVLRIGG